MNAITKETEYNCVECKGRSVRSNGQIVCGECGLVLDVERIDGIYLIRESNVPHGIPSQYVSPTKFHVHDKGLGSEIRNRLDFTYMRMSQGQRYQARRLSSNQRRYGNPHESTLRRTLILLSQKCGVLGISDLYKSQIAMLIRKALKVRRTTNDGRRYAGYLIGIACTEYVVKKNRLMITSDKIVKVWSANWDEGRYRHRTILNQCKMWLQETLGIKFAYVKATDVIPKSISLLKNIPSICGRLEKHGMDPDKFYRQLEVNTMLVFDNTDYLDYQGKNPYVLVASCIYALDRLLGSKTILTQVDVAEATGTNNVSIRDHFKNLWKSIISDLLERSIIRSSKVFEGGE